MTENLFAGIDIGATKANIRIEDSNSRVVDSFTLNGLNYRESNDINYLTYLKSITSNIIERHSTKSFHICFGIAGCSDNQILTTFEKNLKQTRTQSVICKPDSVIALEDCNKTDVQPCLLILGTGSVLITKNKDDYTQTGGWGYLFDPTNGASGLGLLALRYLICILDGKTNDDIFLESYKSYYSTSNLTEKVKSIYQSNYVPRSLADAATPLLRLWDQKHQKTVNIIECFLKDIESNFIALLKKIDSNKPTTLFLMGGLIKNFPNLKKELITTLSDKCTISSQEIIPERGAIKMLRKDKL